MFLYIVHNIDNITNQTTNLSTRLERAQPPTVYSWTCHCRAKRTQERTTWPENERMCNCFHFKGCACSINVHATAEECVTVSILKCACSINVHATAEECVTVSIFKVCLFYQCSCHSRRMCNCFHFKVCLFYQCSCHSRRMCNCFYFKGFV